MRYTAKFPGNAQRRGIVLIAVLVVLVLLTLATYQFSELMVAENRATMSYARAAQARALADSGVHYALAMLASDEVAPASLQADPLAGASEFQSISVREDVNPNMVGRFSLVIPPDVDLIAAGSQVGFSYGLSDEGGKINLNSLLEIDSSGRVARDMLLRLPNMTEEIADAILDWIDADEQPRASGAESDHYQTLSPPYQCKNGPLDTLEELLSVRGITPELLLGNDRNRNGQADDGEENTTAPLDLGWMPYLTLYSREPNLDAEGNQRVFINDTDLAALYPKLQERVGEELAVYILAYRIFGPASGNSQNSATNQEPLTIASLGNLSQPRNQPRSIASLFELVNTSVSVPSMMRQGQSSRHACPLNDPGGLQELLPRLLDGLSTRREAMLPGRINVGTASQAVLAALPGLSDADVQNILQRRPSRGDIRAQDPLFQTTAWLLTEANLQPEQLRTLEQYVTARSQVFRLQSVGHYDGGGPAARVEAVIDASGPRPRVVYYRDLTELGRGFDFTNRQP